MEKIKIYEDCGSIPIYNFFKIIETKDFKYLKINKTDEVDEDHLATTFAKILCEYNELTDNKKLIKNYKSKINIDYLEAKYNISKEIIAIYLEHQNIEILLTLKGFGFTINTSELIMPQIKRINKSLIGIKNRIKIETGRIVNSSAREIRDSTPNFDLEKKIIYLEITIPLSYKIDMYVDSIKRYIHWDEILMSKARAHG